MQQNYGNIPYITVGGRVFTDLDNLIVLHGNVNGAANGNSSLRKASASAGYQVPVGKTFKIMAVEGFVTTAGFGALGYADNDVGIASNTAFTNQVNAANSNNNSLAFATTATGNISNNFRFDVPAQKFPLITNSGNTTVGQVRVYGYEV